MYHLDGRWRRQSLVTLATQDYPNVAVPSGAEMFPGRYSEILGAANDQMFLNLGHSLTLSGVSLNMECQHARYCSKKD